MLNELLSTVDARSGDKIARTLIEHFGSVRQVLSADPIRLMDVKGVTPKHVDVIGACRRTMSTALYEEAKEFSVIDCKAAVERFVRMEIGALKVEQVMCLFLDGGNRIVSWSMVSVGTVNQASVYPRMIIEKAIAHDAAGFIMVHNHPGGSLNASEADWAITERLHKAGKLLDIPMLDHLIVTETKCASMRESARWPS